MRSRWSVLLPLSVWVLGFGVMNLFWLLGEHDPGLPGLYDYRSATWGDGLVLPLLVWGLTLSSPVVSRAGRVYVGTCAALGAAIGAATQVSWLWSADTEPNWTIPEVHHFNAAGWWHAAFLVACSGLVAGLAARAFLPDRQTVPDRVVHLARTVVVFCGPTFLVLLGADNDVDTWGGLAVWGWVAVAVTAGAFVLQAPPRWKHVLAAAGIAALGVHGVAGLVSGTVSSPELWQIGLCLSASVALLYHVFGVHKLSTLVDGALGAVFLMTLPGFATTEESVASCVMVLALLGVSLLIALADGRSVDLRWGVGYPVLLATPLVLFLEVTNSSGPRAGALEVLAWAWLAVASLALGRLFAHVVRAEKRQDLVGENEWNWRSYAAGGALLFGTVMWSIDEIEPARDVEDVRSVIGALVGLIAFLGVAILTGALDRAGALSLALAVVTLGLLWVLGPGLLSESLEGLMALGWVVWVSYWYAAFVANGLYGNLYRMRLVAPEPRDSLRIRLVAVLLFSAMGAAAWLVSGIDDLGAVWVLTPAVVLVVGGLGAGLCYRVGLALVGEDPDYVVPNPPLDGARQDASLIIAEVLVVGWLPLAVWRAADSSVALVVLGSVGTACIPAFAWVLKNNLQHARAFVEQAAAEGDERKVAAGRALARHVRVQNRISLWMAGPFGLLFWLVSRFLEQPAVDADADRQPA